MHDSEKKRDGQYLSNVKFALILLVPAFAMMGFIIVYPLFRAIFMSLTDYSLIRIQTNWVGLQNYLNLFTSKVFLEIFFNTVILSFSTVILSLILGLALALLLNREIRLRNFFRGIVLTIWILPWIVISLLWSYILNSEYGLFNYMLTRIGIISEFLPWLALPILAKISVITIYTWRSTAFMTVMILAGLQTIPDDAMDAARIDGAGAIASFRWITIPYLKQILLIISLLQIIRFFQEFTLIFILTGGGPIYATATLSIEVYKTAFESFEMGRASALGTTWLIFLAIFAFFYMSIITKK